MPQEVHTWKNVQASVGMVSGEVALHFGQVRVVSSTISFVVDSINGTSQCVIELKYPLDESESLTVVKDPSVVSVSSLL